MKVVSNDIITYLTLFLDKLACSSKEQSSPPNLGHEHVAVQVVSNIVHDCSLFPEGSVKTHFPFPEQS